MTGCARGIGLATAARFARAADTVVATVRDPASAEDLRRALDAATRAVEGDGQGPASNDRPASSVEALDVTEGDAVARVIDDTVARHGRIDVLISNAGRSVVGTLEDLTDDDLRSSFEVNFLGGARVIRAVLPAMRAARSGRILALSSMAGVIGNPFNDAYATAKFALEGLFESLAPVVAPFGIHMTLVEPGPVAGEFVTNAGATNRDASPPYAEMFEDFVKVRDAAYVDAPTPEDIAERIFALCAEGNPPLRAQDTEGTTRYVGAKLKDVDGSRVTRILGRMVGADG